ncbi:MAG: hypothetical protein APR63_04845 [Desulfuromonas sp. SDB]|nr:MAG: hypothetical protein APR63_04845 [Desulfuromonas sp. SDB]
MEYQQFKQQWEQKWGKSELGAIKAFLIGVIEYLEDEDKGNKMIALTLPKNYLLNDGTPGRNAFLEYFKKDKGNCAKSYLGGTPDNNYHYQYDFPLDMETNSEQGEWESKIFIRSGGKDNPSPVHLKKNQDGYWKLFNVSSLATGVKKIDRRDF